MTVEHLRILLDNTRDSRMFFRVCAKLAQGKVPDPIIPAIRVGRMTALRKPDGGVRHRCRRCDSPSCRSHHRSAVGKDS